MIQNKTIDEWIQEAAYKLKSVSSTPRLDAETLLIYSLKKNRTFLYTHSDKILTDKEMEMLYSFLEKRYSGVPIAYILEEKEFWSLNFKVTPDVLIPRPETEHLVEIILALLQEKNADILELGTGSGAISIALAKERPHWNILAIDKSATALQIAKENATRLLSLPSSILFQHSDWFQEIPTKKFSAIISNPPYIENHDPHLKNLTYEPLIALVSGENGLDDIRKIIAKAPEYLKECGFLLLEHGNKQATAIYDLLKAANFSDIQTYKDLAGHDRVTVGKKKTT